MKKLLLLVFLAFLTVSCTVDNPTYSATSVQNDNYHNDFPEIINIDDALNNLNNYLISSDMTLTKSGENRKIASIETHYSKIIIPKSGETIPDAYIINFEGNCGFAVLGANSSVAPVVAVTESGFLEKGFLDTEDVNNSITYDVNDNEIDLSNFDFYSKEYDDYYVMTGDDDNYTRYKQQTLRAMIDAALHGGGDDGYRHAIVEPMIKTKWDQGEWDAMDAYNQFCYKFTITGQKKYVLAGCSTTAMAQLVAYNEFPTELYVLNTLVDLSTINNIENANDNTISAKSAQDVGLLLGSIFHSVNPLFVWKAGTCITARQIEKCMELFGYTDVQRLCSNYFDHSLKDETSRMLTEGKPVLLSAMHGINGHSWVIDGSCYFDDDWMLHCNWGWSGLYDGYYAEDCFKPHNIQYDCHFRLITYSIPEYNMTTSINF